MVFGINAGLIIEYFLSNSISTFSECVKHLDEKNLFYSELKKIFLYLIEQNYLIKEETSSGSE